MIETKENNLIPLKKYLFASVCALLFCGCQHYGSDDIPTGIKDQDKAREVYNAFPDTAKIGSTRTADTANSVKDQMEPQNSTGVPIGSTR